ncbi:MAG: Ig-like domain-containing protein [Syntrophomonas sp.]|nr:Ig-like domain-containing protein [Syntrophomonas sp.]MDD3879412.1 Ig-like domain-containing protein [Syntrophomonas sp.]
MNFGSRLKQLREGRKLSTSKLAKQSGLSQSFIWRIESEEKQPTLESLKKLSHGLGISLGELLGQDLMSKPQSSKINRITSNIRKLPPEQVDALDLFIASLSNGHGSGEHTLALKAINLNHSEPDGFEIELVFSANVAAVMEHRIPDGMKRNLECFHLFDAKMKEVPIEVIPGNKRMYGQKAGRTFIIKPLSRLTDGLAYKIFISKLLQANNYSYLREDHTLLFSKQEIMDITPFNQELCSSYLSLILIGSNIASGAENIPVNKDIKLTFSNNVIAKSVRDHNLQCFSLESSKKQSIEIDVIMAEPNDNSEKQNEIIIHPRQALQSNTVYVLTISENLQGINQKRLGMDKIIIFTTGATNITTSDEQIA